MTGSTSSSSHVRLLRASTGANNVFSHPAFSSFILRESLYDWRQSVHAKLDDLCRLPVGWDGYCAPPVSFSNANFALAVLTQACPLNVPEPQIVPGPNGDLQIEWHTEETDIELHVRSPNDVHAWRLARAADDDGDEIDLSTDFSVVAGWLAELSEAPVAAQSSAA